MSIYISANIECQHAYHANIKICTNSLLHVPQCQYCMSTCICMRTCQYVRIDCNITSGWTLVYYRCCRSGSCSFTLTSTTSALFAIWWTTMLSTQSEAWPGRQTSNLSPVSPGLSVLPPDERWRMALLWELAAGRRGRTRWEESGFKAAFINHCHCPLLD